MQQNHKQALIDVDANASTQQNIPSHQKLVYKIFIQSPEYSGIAKIIKLAQEHHLEDNEIKREVLQSANRIELFIDGTLDINALREVRYMTNRIVEQDPTFEEKLKELLGALRRKKGDQPPSLPK